MDPVEKPWYLSKGVWAGVGIVLVGIFKLDMDEVQINSIIEQVTSLITILLGLFATYNRLVATKTVSAPAWLPGGTPADLGTVSNYVPPSAPPAAAQPATQILPPVQYQAPANTYGGDLDPNAVG